MTDQWDEAKNAAREQFERDLDLLLQKASDYSTDNIHAVGAAGVASRLVDKFARLANLLSSKDAPETNESVGDTLRDARNYCTILELKRSGKWPRMIKSVYLAGPIDDVLGGPCMERPHLMARDFGITVFNPKDAYQGAKFAPDVVARINREAIAACDAMLVYWPNRDPSLGTGRDVEYARSKFLDKKVFIVAPWCTSTELQDCIVCRTVEEAFKLMAP